MVGLLLAGTLLGGCSGDDPEPEPTVVEPEYPTAYIEMAVDLWNLEQQDDDARAWRPVTQDGRRWRGDPRTYEKVCGARFLDEDGLVPDLRAPLEGTTGPEQTWYDWLRTQPEAWAAFNAWLQDPAVRKVVGPHARVRDHGVRDDPLEVGDASACEHPERAGTPLD